MRTTTTRCLRDLNRVVLMDGRGFVLIRCTAWMHCPEAVHRIVRRHVTPMNVTPDVADVAHGIRIELLGVQVRRRHHYAGVNSLPQGLLRAALQTVRVHACTPGTGSSGRAPE